MISVVHELSRNPFAIHLPEPDIDVPDSSEPAGSVRTVSVVDRLGLGRIDHPATESPHDSRVDRVLLVEAGQVFVVPRLEVVGPHRGRRLCVRVH